MSTATEATEVTERAEAGTSSIRATGRPEDMFRVRVIADSVIATELDAAKAAARTVTNLYASFRFCYQND